MSSGEHLRRSLPVSVNPSHRIHLRSAPQYHVLLSVSCLPSKMSQTLQCGQTLHLEAYKTLYELSLKTAEDFQLMPMTAQVAGWSQDMCLNRSRQRRRHRRSIEDWFHLSEHALVADSSPGFQAWLQTASSLWHWPEDQEDTQVLMSMRPCNLKRCRLQSRLCTMTHHLAPVWDVAESFLVHLWLDGALYWMLGRAAGLLPGVKHGASLLHGLCLHMPFCVAG